MAENVKIPVKPAAFKTFVSSLKRPQNQNKNKQSATVRILGIYNVEWRASRMSSMWIRRAYNFSQSKLQLQLVGKLPTCLKFRNTRRDFVN